jgi:hypothetical protein
MYWNKNTSLENKLEILKFIVEEIYGTIHRIENDIKSMGTIYDSKYQTIIGLLRSIKDA